MLATDAAVPIIVNGSAMATAVEGLLAINLVEDMVRLGGSTCLGFGVRSMVHSPVQGASHLQGVSRLFHSWAKFLKESGLIMQEYPYILMKIEEESERIKKRKQNGNKRAVAKIFHRYI